MVFFPVAQLQTPTVPNQASPKDQLLAQMKDVITPDPVGLWPPAPGWWILAVTVAVLIFLLVYVVQRQRRANRYRKLALQELHTIAQQASKKNDNDFVAAINTLLKKTAFCAYAESRDDLAGLYGRRWRSLLDTVMKKPFPQSLPSDWTDAIYQVPGSIDTPSNKITRKPLVDYAEFWIKHHRKLSPEQLRTVLHQTQTGNHSSESMATGSAQMEAQHV